MRAAILDAPLARLRLDERRWPMSVGGVALEPAITSTVAEHRRVT